MCTLWYQMSSIRWFVPPWGRAGCTLAWLLCTNFGDVDILNCSATKTRPDHFCRQINRRGSPAQSLVDANRKYESVSACDYLFILFDPPQDFLWFLSWQRQLAGCPLFKISKIHSVSLYTAFPLGSFTKQKTKRIHTSRGERKKEKGKTFGLSDRSALARPPTVPTEALIYEGGTISGPFWTKDSKCNYGNPCRIINASFPFNMNSFGQSIHCLDGSIYLMKTWQQTCRGEKCPYR